MADPGGWGVYLYAQPLRLLEEFYLAYFIRFLYARYARGLGAPHIIRIPIVAGKEVPMYRAGDIVVHWFFGLGEVLGVEGGSVKVQFCGLETERNILADSKAMYRLGGDN